MSTTPRSLILSLLVGTEAPAGKALSVRELLAACAVFGLEENSARVALARGVASGLLVSPRRGAYALGPAAWPIAREVSQCRATLSRLVDWSGGWIAIHVGATGRSDRSALRARERAFNLLGLAEFERGLHLRPDNLNDGIAGLRRRLTALLPEGVEAGTVFKLQDLSLEDQQRACGLWDGPALDAGYRDATAQMAAWMDAAPDLPLTQAAREVFGLGNDAIRRVVFDPLLPAPLVDEQARARFVTTTARFDDLGKAIWQRFLASVHERPKTATEHSPRCP
jgi:phenylacetic acid degradation operon negative regulatory protein